MVALFGGGHWRETSRVLTTLAVCVPFAVILHRARDYVGRALASLIVVALAVACLLAPLEPFFSEDDSSLLAGVVRRAGVARHLAGWLAALGLAVVAAGERLAFPPSLPSRRFGVVAVTGAALLALVLADGPPGDHDGVGLIGYVIGHALTALGFVALLRSGAPKHLWLALPVSLLALAGWFAAGRQGMWMYGASTIAGPLAPLALVIAYTIARARAFGPQPLHRLIAPILLIASAATAWEYLARETTSWATQAAAFGLLLVAGWYALAIAPPTEGLVSSSAAIGGDPYRASARAGVEPLPRPSGWARWVGAGGAAVAAVAALYWYEASENARSFALSYETESRMVDVSGYPVPDASFYESASYDFARDASHGHELFLMCSVVSVALVIATAVLHVRHRRALAAWEAPPPAPPAS
jgi:hypothetical protein